MKEINIRDIKISATELINDNWGLVAAGTEKSFNMMTISWGALGEMWGKDAAFIFVRPNRYTFNFLEDEPFFTVSFFGPEYHKALQICGTKSGRDINKAEASGLTPLFSDGTVAFNEAKYVLVCRKMSGQFLSPDSFIDSSINSNYNGTDYHKMYIGEILKVYAND